MTTGTKQFDPSGMNAVVLGLGRFGGGAGVTRFLCERGANVTVSDPLERAALGKPIESLADIEHQIEWRLGDQSPEHVSDAQLVVVNPAIPRPFSNPVVQAAIKKGSIVTTEIALTLNTLRHATHEPRLIGITGSAGKSTTTSLVAAGAEASGISAIAGGNIGGSLLHAPPTDLIALELSSAMLWWLRPGSPSTLPIRPLDAAVITTYAPNHLDWHTDEQEYRDCKASIASLLRVSAPIVLGPDMTEWPVSMTSNRIDVTAETFAKHQPGTQLTIPGEHNRLNAALAIAALNSVGVDPSRSATGITSFAGLPHRLEIVGSDHSGVLWVNDSKCTTPDGTRTAVESIAERCQKIHLIAGGADKGVPLDDLAKLPAVVATVHAIGSTGDSIARADPERAQRHRDLEAAVAACVKRASEHDAILLSPACASWDQFDNYEQRGDLFKNLARTHGAGA